MQEPAVLWHVSTVNTSYPIKIRLGNKLEKAVTGEKKSQMHYALKICKIQRIAAQCIEVGGKDKPTNHLD